MYRYLLKCIVSLWSFNNLIFFLVSIFDIYIYKLCCGYMYFHFQTESRLYSWLLFLTVRLFIAKDLCTWVFIFSGLQALEQSQRLSAK